MNKKKSSLLLITASVMIVLVLTLTGCVHEDRDDLDGTNWVLKAINGTQPMSDTSLTIEFIDKQISGSAGCNHFGGEYKLDGEKIQFISVYNTEMYCMEPEGIMDQEQVYLGALRAADRFSLTEEELVVFDTADRYLKFSPYESGAAEVPSGDKNDTVQIEAPTETPADEAPNEVSPPWAYNQYQDAETGIGISIPEAWIVTGIIEGEYAILQSYPENKYVGGEARQEGDTKCDLNIKPSGIGSDELINQIKSSPMTTILSEEPFSLNSGQVGTRFEIDSMGQSISVVTELDGRAVILTCFGDFSRVDEIAATLNHQE